MNFALFNEGLVNFVEEVKILDDGDFSTGGDHRLMCVTLTLGTKAFFPTMGKQKGCIVC